MSNHERQGPQLTAGDAGLERAWRQASDESPPSSLDAAIVAAAREAVGNPETARNVVHGRFASRPWLARWQPIAAAAAVAGLAFTLVQTLPRESAVTEVPIRMEGLGGGVTADVQTQIGPAPTRQKAVDAPADSAVEAAATAAGGAAAGGVAIDTATEAPPPRDAVPAAAVTSSPVTAQGAGSRPTASESFAGSVAEAVAAPDAERRRSEGATAAPSPQDQAARIVALHSAGDLTSAVAALREFRATVDDADRFLPESMRAWADTVPPVPPLE
jgi:hypothetical protein